MLPTEKAGLLTFVLFQCMFESLDLGLQLHNTARGVFVHHCMGGREGGREGGRRSNNNSTVMPKLGYLVLDHYHR